MRTILFTGKGGVGKTTLSASMALASAARGYRTLVISTDAAHSLSDALGIRLDGAPREVCVDGPYAAELDTAEELERAWGDVRRRLAAVLAQQGTSGPISGELAIIPGLDEILALARIKRLQDEGRFDAIIIDSAPTGAAMRLLGAPDLQRLLSRDALGLSHGLGLVLLPALRAAVRTVASETFIEQQLGQLMQQVEELRALLCDSARTSVRLVLNPDHLSLQETQRAFTYFSLFGLAVDALYVNRILPNEVSDPFFVDWRVDQARHLDEIRESFAPLPVSEVPLRRREVVGVSALAELGRAVFGAADPIPPQADARAMAFRSDGRLQVLALRVSGLSPEGVDVQKSGADLHLRLGRFRRSVVLPQYLAAMNPVWARVEGSELLVAFEEPT